MSKLIPHQPLLTRIIQRITRKYRDKALQADHVKFWTGHDDLKMRQAFTAKFYQQSEARDARRS